MFPGQGQGALRVLGAVGLVDDREGGLVAGPRVEGGLGVAVAADGLLQALEAEVLLYALQNVLNAFAAPTSVEPLRRAETHV